jgi:MoaA/NifB/PqqE/SkfB family radical SAM enzyme
LKYVREGHELGLAVKVASNGIALGKAGVLEKLGDAGVEGIQISLHSGPKAKRLHDNILGCPGAFDLACASAGRALELGFNLTVRYTLTPQNTSEAVDCCRYIAGMPRAGRLPRFKIRECVEAGRAGPEWIIKRQCLLTRVRRVYVELIGLAQSREIDLELTQPYHGPSLHGTRVAPPECLCGAQDGIAYLDENGRVYPCQFLLHHSAWCIGNVREESIARIWDRWLRSEASRHFRTLPRCMAEEIIRNR